MQTTARVPTGTEPPALRISELSKSFGASRALDRVSIELRRGEVLGLLGHNGSGKSTLIKCLAGFYRPDEIEALEIDGKRLGTDAKSVAPDQRIAFVHQDLGLLSELTVLENFLLTDQRALSGTTVPWNELKESVRAALHRYGLNFPLEVTVDTLEQADRCLIAVVRAIEALGPDKRSAGASRILILDEPTPFLPAKGVEKLFSLMRTFVEEGGSIIFVAHDIDEVMTITDRIVVLRDGRKVSEFNTAETERDAVIEAIVGRTLQHHHVRSSGATRVNQGQFWRVSNLSSETVVDCNFTLCSGEILGVTGLIGSGAAALPELVSGARRAYTGKIEGPGWETVDLASATIHEQMARGICLLPDDRLRKSGVGGLTLAENIALPSLTRFTSMLRLKMGAVEEHVNLVVQDSGVIPPNPLMTLQSFSGGNQQKALIAKWLALHPRILSLCEPTQGVDIGSRQTIYAAIEAAAMKGASVLCYSSDAGELAQICDRVIIMAGGQVIIELRGENLTKDAIVAASLGLATESVQDQFKRVAN